MEHGNSSLFQLAGRVLLAALTGMTAAVSAAPALPQLAPGTVVDMQTVEVKGAQPGPGLWKVSNAQGHTLWLLGTVTPLPAGIEWTATEVTAVIDRADHVLMAPGARLKNEIGFFRGMTLLPGALRAKRDPEGRTLQQVVPPAAYARWQTLKPLYLGRDRGVEKDRPLLAAAELYEAFLKRNRLGSGAAVSEVLERAYKARGLTPEDTRLVIDVPDLRAAVKELQGTAMDDLPCFEQTLDAVEFQLPVLRERANAWALGDVAALRRLASAGRSACTSAVENSTFARRHGFSDAMQRGRTLWVDRAAAALAAHEVTFAALPIRLLVGEGVYLQALQARGFVVEAPPE